MQHSLQHVSLTLSQVSKINRQSTQNFVKNISYITIILTTEVLLEFFS